MAEEMTVERDHDNVVVTMPLKWIESVIGGSEFKNAHRYGVEVVDHDGFMEDLVKFLSTSRGVESMIESEVAFGLECDDDDYDDGRMQIGGVRAYPVKFVPGRSSTASTPN